MPHRLMQDDLYDGYLLPKGSIVIANIWYIVPIPQNKLILIATARSILHNPEMYHDPFRFDPSRFAPENAGTKTEPDPREYCFGFGRRCVRIL